MGICHFGGSIHFWCLFSMYHLECHIEAWILSAKCRIFSLRYEITSTLYCVNISNKSVISFSRYDI